MICFFVLGWVKVSILVWYANLIFSAVSTCSGVPIAWSRPSTSIATRSALPETWFKSCIAINTVKFSFFTEEEIKEAHGKVEGKEFLLTLANSWYPGPKFLRKYGIEVDRSFDCYLKVITKGTCTPILFDFPAINLSDYFESRWLQWFVIRHL